MTLFWHSLQIVVVLIAVAAATFGVLTFLAWVLQQWGAIPVFCVSVCLLWATIYVGLKTQDRP